MAEAEAQLRVYIIADNPLARVGLASLLSEQINCQVVGQGADNRDLLPNLDVFQPDVVLWDIDLVNLNESQNLPDLLELDFPLVVMVSDEQLASDLWQIGVRGLLLRDTNGERLAAALLAVSQHLTVLDLPLVDALNTLHLPLLDVLPEALTERELEVLNLLAEGLSNKAIAYQLGISDHTIKFHVTALLNKLDAQSRTEAVVKATRLGLIHL